MTICTYKCKKELFKLNIPIEVIREVITYCSWTYPKPSCMWYIIASKFDTNGLIRAKQVDRVKEYLASDDENDCLFIFKHTKDEVFDYVRHIENNRTV
jgi:hypothetical protein